MSLITAQKVTCNILFHKSYKSFQVSTSGDGLYLTRNNIKTIYICILFHIAQCFTGSKSFKLPSLILKMLCKTKHTLHPFKWWMTIPIITTSEKLTFYIMCKFNIKLNRTGISVRYWPLVSVIRGIFFLLVYANQTWSSFSCENNVKIYLHQNLPNVCFYFWDNITGTGLCQL